MVRLAPKGLKARRGRKVRLGKPALRALRGQWDRQAREARGENRDLKARQGCGVRRDHLAQPVQRALWAPRGQWDQQGLVAKPANKGRLGPQRPLHLLADSRGQGVESLGAVRLYIIPYESHHDSCS